ncbi:MAG: hypothetical protein RLZZ555_2154, partial [Pseudomonadota bacterium]
DNAALQQSKAAARAVNGEEAQPASFSDFKFDVRH